MGGHEKVVGNEWAMAGALALREAARDLVGRGHIGSYQQAVGRVPNRSATGDGSWMSLAWQALIVVMYSWALVARHEHF